MNFNFEKILRYFLFFLGFIGLVFITYSFYILVSSIFNNSLENLTQDSGFFSQDFVLLCIIAFISYYLIKISIKWKDFFLSFSKSLISFAIICFSFSFIFFAIGNNSDELTNSIQPSIDFILLSSTYDIFKFGINNNNNPNRTFNLSYLGNPIYLNFNNIDNKSLNIVWRELGFKENISLESKKYYLKFILSQIEDQVFPQNNSKNSISVETLSSIISPDIKLLCNYDIFSSEIDVRIKNLGNLRNDCINNIFGQESQYFSILCEQIVLTSYDNIIKNIDKTKSQNLNDNHNNQIDSNQTDFLNQNLIFDSFSSLNSIENSLAKYKYNFYKFLLLSLFLILFSIISQIIHLKINILSDSPIDIGHFISKYNLLFYLPSYLISLIIFYLIYKDIFFNLITSLFSSLFSFDSQILTQMPIMVIVKDISLEFIILSTFYLFFSILIFLIYFLLVKKSKKRDIKIQVNSDDTENLIKFENPQNSEVTYNS